jgi:hypothetical protein
MISVCFLIPAPQGDSEERYSEQAINTVIYPVYSRDRILPVMENAEVIVTKVGIRVDMVEKPIIVLTNPTLTIVTINVIEYTSPETLGALYQNVTLSLQPIPVYDTTVNEITGVEFGNPELTVVEVLAQLIIDNPTDTGYVEFGTVTLTVGPPP